MRQSLTLLCNLSRSELARASAGSVHHFPRWHLFCAILKESKNETQMTTTSTLPTYNGWATYETWNVALWMQNDEFLYNTAKACVEYCGDNETPYDKFVRCMMEGQIGRMLGQTRDNVRWDSVAIDHDEINEMMIEL